MRRIKPLFQAVALIAAIAAAFWVERQFAENAPSLVTSGEKVETAGKRPRAIDGDSMALDNQEMRIIGIDAPEYRQLCDDGGGNKWDCGKQSRLALAARIKQANFACYSEARDKFGRHLVRCLTRDTPDIGAAQVADGWAITNGIGDTRTYPREEDAARQAKLGIWRGDFTMPRQYRDEHQRPPAEPGLLEQVTGWIG